MREPITCYQLKIALPYIEPEIWRRLEVSGEVTFAALHNTIQVAMGWENCHLWTFHVGDTEISPESEHFSFPGVPRARAADKFTLNEILAKRRIKFRYEYDMGDSWLHEIKVEKVGFVEPGVQYPRCTGGARACPPEDCGGFPDYMNILESFADPKHPEREELLEWIGEDFNPEAFDIDAVNRRLLPRKRRLFSAKKKTQTRTVREVYAGVDCGKSCERDSRSCEV